MQTKAPNRATALNGRPQRAMALGRPRLPEPRGRLGLAVLFGGFEAGFGAVFAGVFPTRGFAFCAFPADAALLERDVLRAFGFAGLVFAIVSPEARVDLIHRRALHIEAICEVYAITGLKNMETR